MKPKLTKSLTIKAYGPREDLVEFTKVLNSNFTIIAQDINYNQTHGNYEVWVTTFTEGV